jgi:hypothetical protein
MESGLGERRPRKSRRPFRPPPTLSDAAREARVKGERARSCLHLGKDRLPLPPPSLSRPAAAAYSFSGNDPHVCQSEKEEKAVHTGNRYQKRPLSPEMASAAAAGEEKEGPLPEKSIFRFPRQQRQRRFGPTYEEAERR